MKTLLINPTNIVKVIYVSHEKFGYFEYHPAKNYKWFKLFNQDEYWKSILPLGCHYTREELLIEYPDYMIDENNELVTKEPVLYIHYANGNSDRIKRNTEEVLSMIKKCLPNVLIIGL